MQVILDKGGFFLKLHYQNPRMRPSSILAVLLLLAHPLLAGVPVDRPETGAKAPACCCATDCAPPEDPCCHCQAPTRAPSPDPILPASQGSGFEIAKSLAAPVRPVTVAMSDGTRALAAGVSQVDEFAYPATAPIYILLHRLRN